MAVGAVEEDVPLLVPVTAVDVKSPVVCRRLASFPLKSAVLERWEGSREGMVVSLEAYGVETGPVCRVASG